MCQAMISFNNMNNMINRKALDMINKKTQKAPKIGAFCLPLPPGTAPCTFQMWQVVVNLFLQDLMDATSANQLILQFFEGFPIAFCGKFSLFNPPAGVHHVHFRIGKHCAYGIGIRSG